MRLSELLRLVWLNINQNKFKTVMTSIGIIVGAATIVMVIAIGRGGKMDVAEQFASLNAGSIDITYDYEGEETTAGGSGTFSISDLGSSLMGGVSSFFNMGGGDSSSSRGDRNSSNASDSGSDASSFGGMTMGGDSASDGDSSSGGGRNMGSDSSSDGASGGRSEMGGMGDFSDSDLSDIAEAFSNGDMDMSDIASMFSEDDTVSADREEAGEDGADRADSGEGMSSENGEAEADGTEDVSEEDDMTEAAAAVSADEEEETESETDLTDSRLNQENIILTIDDVEDIETFVTELDGATISYTSRTSVEGGDLTSAETYTVAGVYYSYYTVSNLSMAEGEFITDEESNSTARVCVLGSTVAKELFGSAEEAYGETLYLDDRAYEVVGVLDSSSTVSANITPDESIFIPYETGIKYITGTDISPVITVICNDVDLVDSVKEKVETVLEENYSTAEFTFSDASSKLEAAESSNEILTMLLSAMAVIVFIVGGIGIMNVLFVSVKERTEEIGILKSLGASRSNILFEFLFESAAISMIGGILGVGASFLVTPLVEYNGIRVEANVNAWAAALAFSILTGTIFGFYPAWKASKLVPVEALNSD
ncbi:MAG: ABC transporter permease [Lachnospiraceae bacterium]|nr:ABC transporter permease [Lachnospiraceae bacterium]